MTGIHNILIPFRALDDCDPTAADALQALQDAAIACVRAGIVIQGSRLYGQEDIATMLMIRGVDFVDGKLVLLRGDDENQLR